MARRREKSELERYLDGMMSQLRFQELKRPEEWVKYGSIVLIVWFVPFENYLLLATLMILSLVVQVGLAKRRLGAKDASQVLVRSLPEIAAKNARRELRKGTYDAKVGPEARAILESCAASANATIGAGLESHMLNGGGRAALDAFKPLTGAMESLMKSALTRVQSVTIMKRLPGEEALADLGAIEARLAELRDEA